MIKLVYFDFNFWRVDILRLSLGYSKVPYEYKRIKRQEWPKEKEKFPFGQLPIIIIEDKQYAHTHSLARFCALESKLYDNNKLKAMVIDQVLDWANEITNKIAPSIRAAIRDKDLEKSNRLREEFIKNDLLVWFSYLEKLFDQNSKKKNFFNDKFSMADIVAWRVIYWFYCGMLDKIDNKFLDKFPLIQNFFKQMNTFKSFTIYTSIPFSILLLSNSKKASRFIQLFAGTLFCLATTKKGSRESAGPKTRATSGRMSCHATRYTRGPAAGRPVRWAPTCA